MAVVVTTVVPHNKILIFFEYGEVNSLKVVGGGQ
jgi:hypothetical protein